MYKWAFKGNEKKERKEEINTMLKEIKEDLQNLRKQAINNDNL